MKNIIKINKGLITESIKKGGYKLHCDYAKHIGDKHPEYKKYSNNFICYNILKGFCTIIDGEEWKIDFIQKMVMDLSLDINKVILHNIDISTIVTENKTIYEEHVIINREYIREVVKENQRKNILSIDELDRIIPYFKHIINSKHESSVAINTAKCISMILNIPEDKIITKQEYRRQYLDRILNIKKIDELCKELSITKSDIQKIDSDIVEYLTSHKLTTPYNYKNISKLASILHCNITDIILEPNVMNRQLIEDYLKSI